MAARWLYTGAKCIVHGHACVTRVGAWPHDEREPTMLAQRVLVCKR